MKQDCGLKFLFNLKSEIRNSSPRTRKHTQTTPCGVGSMQKSRAPGREAPQPHAKHTQPHTNHPARGVGSMQKLRMAGREVPTTTRKTPRNRPRARGGTGKSVGVRTHLPISRSPLCSAQCITPSPGIPGEGWEGDSDEYASKAQRPANRFQMSKSAAATARGPRPAARGSSPIDL